MKERVVIQWRDVVGYEDIYEVSDHFFVRKKSRKKDKPLGISIIYPTKEVGIYFHRDNYVVSLRKNGKSKLVKLVKVVADAFIPNPNPAEFDTVTINGEYKTYGDLTLNMLEWTNRSIIQERRYRDAGVNSFAEKLSSEFPGVYAEKRQGIETGKYIAKVRVKGKQKIIGRYDSPEDAKFHRDRHLKLVGRS